MRESFITGKIGSLRSWLVFSLALFFVPPLSRPVQAQTTQRIPFEIVHSATSTESGGGLLIYVYLPDKYYDRESLENVFSEISAKRGPSAVRITAISDRSAIQKHIDLDVARGSYLYSSTSLRESELFDDISGYFRAFFLQNSEIKVYKYSARKEELRHIFVTLRNTARLENTREALLDATKTGDLERVKWILSQQPRLEINSTGDMLLGWAFWLRHHEIARKLIKEGADINGLGIDGNRPIFNAIDARDFDGVKILLEAKANINLSTKGGKTPLMSASLYCDYQIAELLLKNGAKIDVRDSQGKSVFDYACKTAEFTRLLSSGSRRTN